MPAIEPICMVQCNFIGRTKQIIVAFIVTRVFSRWENVLQVNAFKWEKILKKQIVVFLLKV